MWWSFDKRCSSVLWVIGGKKRKHCHSFPKHLDNSNSSYYGCHGATSGSLLPARSLHKQNSLFECTQCFPFSSRGGTEWHSPAPPQTEAARRSVQNQSAPALKGQYVANKHTEWVNAEPLVRQKQSSLCGPIPALHTLSGYYHVKRAPGWWMNHQAIRAAASERPRLNHYHHLLFTGPSIYWPTMSSC